MPLYNCEYCYYSTKNKQHFTKHKNTKKHRNKLKDGIKSRTTRPYNPK